ncbi:EamA family transporter [Flavihumibacter rivuli]|uniref:DMT family transporter n=1 Tax=Flavihumibacter rivuli TaxID=2838156 RepID=UPI001BDE4E6F|nr:EamA family transporter [Flavihumibacter rivuli]ULQ57612.1 EamA family transporter [Flavihumibacter rivuli]
MNSRFIVTGVIFALLWASASTATKIALTGGQPFILSITRFFLAGTIMIIISHLFSRNRLPVGKEWRALAIYGLLNVTLYLGLYVIAMQTTSAGLASLAIAINPVLISILAAIVFKYRFSSISIISLILCTAGVTTAAWPLLKSSYATPLGLTTLVLSMVAYSAGAIFFTRTNWNQLDKLTINGWQTLLGGFFLLPFAWWKYDASRNQFDLAFWGGTLWLALPVSIGAVWAWMYLLREDAVKAAYWLYLCPVFGFLLAWLILGEPVSLFTMAGILLVVSGLYLVQRYQQPQRTTEKK